LTIEIENKIRSKCMIRCMKDVRRTFHRTGRFVDADGVGWQARLWFGWKLNWQWCLLPISPLAVAILLQPPVLLGILLLRLVRRARQSP
jgi:hypothetical protein